MWRRAAWAAFLFVWFLPSNIRGEAVNVCRINHRDTFLQLQKIATEDAGIRKPGCQADRLFESFPEYCGERSIALQIGRKANWHHYELTSIWRLSRLWQPVVHRHVGGQAEVENVVPRCGSRYQYRSTANFECYREAVIGTAGQNESRVQINVSRCGLSHIGEIKIQDHVPVIPQLNGGFWRLWNGEKGADLGASVIDLALHNTPLLVGAYTLIVSITGEKISEYCNGGSGGGCDSATVLIQPSNEGSDGATDKSLPWRYDKVVSVLTSALVLIFGYLAVAWGGGALILWRNPGGLLGGGIAILFGIACIGHGFMGLIR